MGLALSVVTHATGFVGHAPGKHRAGARQDPRAKVAVLEGPGKRFDRSVEIASDEAARAQARAEQASATTGQTGSTSEGVTSVPSPESLGVSSATLESVAACESGGDPTAISADGTYRGKYQFDYGTWASVGGSGDPAAAPVAEQDYRAALLYSRGGSSPWPVCG